MGIGLWKIYRQIRKRIWGILFHLLFFFFFTQMCCEIKNWSKSGKTHTHRNKKAKNNIFSKRLWEISIDIGKEEKENKHTIRSTSYVCFSYPTTDVFENNPLSPFPSPIWPPNPSSNFVSSPPDPSPNFFIPPCEPPCGDLRDKTSTKIVCCGCELNIVV